MTGIFDSLDPIDALILSVGLGKGSAALTLLEQQSYDSVRLTAPASAGLFFDLYPRAGQKKIGLDGAAGYGVTVRCGTSMFALNPGGEGLFLQDGTPDGLSKAQAFGGGSLVLPTLSLANGKYPILSKSLKDGSQPLTKGDRKKAQIVRLTGADGSGGAGNTLTLEPYAGTVVIGSEPWNSVTVHIEQGTADFELEPGDVFAFISDATPNGLSRQSIGSAPGGGVPSLLWQTVSGPHTVESGDRIDLDSSGGSFVLTLSSGPSGGDWFELKNTRNTLTTHPVTLARNGKSICGEADDVSLDADGFSAEFAFAADNWGL
jgi:hypothetical protein